MAPRFCFHHERFLSGGNKTLRGRGLVTVEYEQLTLEPQTLVQKETRVVPLPFLCRGCVERDPATNPPCPVCGVDVVEGVGIPF